MESPVNKSQSEEEPTQEASKVDAQTTTRYCKARITNRWGTRLTKATLRHRRSNDEQKEDKKTWDLIEKDEDSELIDITFETGLPLKSDYWWVEFTANGETWTCKEKFSCWIQAGDQGTIIDCILKSHDKELLVSMTTGDCKTKIFKKK